MIWSRRLFRAWMLLAIAWVSVVGVVLYVNSVTRQALISEELSNRDRISRKLARVRMQNAPQTDIEKYLKSEGFIAEAQLRDTRGIPPPLDWVDHIFTAVLLSLFALGFGLVGMWILRGLAR